MRILKKNYLEQYWNRDSILNTPFLATTCPEIIFKTSCGIFTSVIQMRPTHQREKQIMILCFLVRPMVDIMQRNFHKKYRPGKELSLDESTCPFKGRVHFKCYNPKKPNRFHIKLLWSVNLALATFVALKFIQEMHLASHRAMHRNYRMHQKLLALS